MSDARDVTTIHYSMKDIKNRFSLNAHNSLSSPSLLIGIECGLMLICLKYFSSENLLIDFKFNSMEWIQKKTFFRIYYENYI